MNNPPAQAQEAPAQPGRLLVWALFLLSGACALIYEVLWCRQLGLVFGNTVQSLSAVLTAYMSGLALGSYLAGRLCHRLKRPLLAYGVLELLIGIYCAALPWMMSDSGPLVPLYRWLYGETGSGSLVAVRFVLSLLLLLVPTTFMGATLPVLSMYLVKSRAALGSTVGALYAVNTFGAVAGAAATGFILLPELGKSGTNWLAVACNVALGIVAIRAGLRSSVSAGTGEASVALGTGAQVDETSKPVETPAHGTPALPGKSPQLPGAAPYAVRAAILAFGVTGFAAMVTQIAWTRAISLCTGSTTYAFSLIVSVFILGLSIGGMLGARAVRSANGRDPLAALATVLLSTALLCAIVILLLGISPNLFFFLLAWGSNSSWGALLAVQALGIAMLIAGPTILMGATLPLTMQAASRYSTSPGRAVGTIYAVNTVGAILGSFLGGILLLPALQIQNTLAAMVLFYALPGLALFALSSRRRERRQQVWMAGLSVSLLALLLFMPRWNPAVMASGSFLLRDKARLKAARELRLREAWSPPAIFERLYYKEGLAATVSVFKIQDTIVLSVGGKPDASSYGDMCTQISLTLLPELLHPGSPEEVLVIGLGSGVSAGAALACEGVKRVDVVEISPEIVEASVYFKPFNGLSYSAPDGSPAHQPPCRIDTPGIEVLLNDGRNHLLLTSRGYDVIASEPSNPWMAGVANLFTRQAFELCRRRLKPGGVMSQWIHNYAMDREQFEGIVRTFGEVFKHAQLWHVNGGDFLLLGSDSPLAIPLTRLRRRMGQPAVQAWLAKVHCDREEELLAGFLRQDRDLRDAARDAPVLTDDNMRLEFGAPKALYKPPAAVRGRMPAPEEAVEFDAPEDEYIAFLKRLDLATAGRAHIFQSGSPSPAVVERHHRLAWRLAPYGFWALDSRNIEDGEEANRLLEGSRLSERSPRNPDAAIALLSQAKLRSAHMQYPRDVLNQALGERAVKRMNAGDVAGALVDIDAIESERASKILLLRARALGMQNKFDEALALAAKAAAQPDARPFECAELTARIHWQAGRPADALALADSLLAQRNAGIDSSAAPLWALHAELLVKVRNDRIRAAQSLRTASELRPDEPSHVLNEARALLQLGRMPEALERFMDHTAADPGNPAAQAELIHALLLAAEKSSTERPELALRMARFARCCCQELTALHPDSPTGWDWSARAFLVLEVLHAARGPLYRQQAKACFEKLLALRGGDESKLPRDLVDMLKENH